MAVTGMLTKKIRMEARIAAAHRLAIWMLDRRGGGVSLVAGSGFTRRGWRRGFLGRQASVPAVARLRAARPGGGLVQMAGWRAGCGDSAGSGWRRTLPFG
jgi:hypothetical protein